MKLCQMNNFSEQRVLRKVANRSENIDRRAIYGFLQNHSKAISRQEVKNLFSYFDRDKDGLLSSKEIMDVFLPKTDQELGLKVKSRQFNSR